MSTEIKRSARQLFRFGIVGIASNISGYLLYLLITYWGVEPKKAMTFLYLVGATIGFVGNRQWTFSHSGTLLDSSTKYLVTHFFGYLINLVILFAFVDMLGYSHQWVQAVAIFVVAGFLFIVFKYFVFPVSSSPEKGVE